MKLNELILIIIGIVIIYSLTILSISSTLFSSTSINPIVYTHESGDQFICGNYYSETVSKIDYNEGNYFSGMNTFCENEGFQCQIWGVLPSISSSFGNNYINCDDRYGYHPIRSQIYECGQEEAPYGYTNIYEEAKDYCNTLAYECYIQTNIGTYGVRYFLHCDDKEPNTVCYTCNNNTMVFDEFVDFCPQGWFNETLDCRENVECVKCEDKEKVFDTQKEECGVGWTPLNQTIVDDEEYCYNPTFCDRVKESIVNNWLITIIFILSIIILIGYYYKTRSVKK